MNLDVLRSFFAIAEFGSLSRAAEQLHVSQSTLTRQVARADIVVSEARKLALGQSASLRIGYLMSAAGEYLNPALATLRRSHPETKVRLVDLSPGEQITALRRGELDVVVLGNINPALAREFFVRRIATLPVLVAENAVTLLPGLVSKFKVPGVSFRPLRSPPVKWELQVAWQRGKIAEPVRDLVNLLTKKPA